MGKALKLFLLLLGAGAAGYTIYRLLKRPKEINLSDSVALYERIIEKRPIEDVADLLHAADVDFVFRGFYKDTANWGYARDDLFEEHFGKALYPLLADYISYLKSKKPSILIQGGISVAILDTQDTWADRTPFSEQDIEDMVLHDKYGEPIEHYFGHATNLASERYRAFIIGWVEKQIDAGVDSLFFDEIFVPIKYQATNQSEYEALMELYENVYWKDIVDRTRAYASSKNKTVYISANSGYSRIPHYHPMPFVDIYTVGICSDEYRINFEDMTIHEDLGLLRQKVTDAYGKPIPIIVFIDWDNRPEGPLGLFANMPVDKQNEFLRMVDESTKANGILFVYPMHGGQPGFNDDSPCGGTYDSVRCGTYDTIKELALDRARE